MSSRNERDKTLPTQEQPWLTGRDWLLLLICLALAALFCHCFDFYRPQLDRYFREVGGCGFTLFLLGGLAAALWRLGRRSWSKEQYAQIGVYLALACGFTLLGDPLLRQLNMLLCIVVVPWTLFSLAGVSSGSPWQGAALVQTLSRLLPSLFRFLPRPFLSLLRPSPGRRGRSLLLGLLLALPLLLIAGSLLAAADAVFRGLFTDLEQWLETLSLGRAAWVALRTLFVGLCGFSLLYGLTQPLPPSRERKLRPGLPLLSWNVILVLLDAVYLLFVVIQFAVLFGGSETAAIRGGYAEYARSGFFQLAAVALLNLGLLLRARQEWPDQKSLRISGSLLLACTAVILVSALWRMSLYIDSFGLSVLRAVTLWGMAMIGLALALTGVKLWRPRFSIYKPLLIIVLVSWLAFNYSGVDRWVSQWNVDRYLSGELAQVDVDYLSRNLSPAARPALTDLAEQGHGKAQRALRELDDCRDQLTWADWSLPWLIYK